MNEDWIHTYAGRTSALDSKEAVGPGVAGVGEAAAPRLSGRKDDTSCTLAWLVELERPEPELGALGRFPASIRLGGMYSLGFDGPASPDSEPPSLLWGPLDPARSLDRTASTIVLRTFFFVISFLRSARAASVTWAPEKSSMTEDLAHSRT